MPITEPEILALVPSVNEVRIDLYIPRELSWFEGHFPGCPLLPGVIQVTWAIEFGRKHLTLPPQFASLSTMKFMRFIVPDSRVTLRLAFDATRRELTFQYREANAVCSEGVVGFAAPL